MQIDRNNYEIFAIDYIEGNLPSDIRDDFTTFLDRNPDLKNEIEDLNDYKLSKIHLSFISKNLLKKDSLNEFDGLNRFELLSIGQIENDLTPAESAQLEEFLTGSGQKRHEFLMFQRTKLIPDESIIFKDKNKLKRKILGKTILRFHLISGIAASIMFLIGFMLLLQPGNIEKHGKTFSSNSGIIKTSRAANKSVQEQYITTSDILSKNTSDVKNIKETDNSDTFITNPVSLKKIIAVENSFNRNKTMNLNDIVNYNSHLIEPDNVPSNRVESYFDRQIKEKLLKRPENKKFTLASAGKIVRKVARRILGNEFRIDKKIMEDGSKLYAFKTGSIEIYTNIKPGKREDHQNFEKENNRQEPQKE